MMLELLLATLFGAVCVLGGYIAARKRHEPWVGRVSVLEPKPDETLLIEFEHWLSPAALQRARREIVEAFPGVRVVVFNGDQRARVEVVRFDGPRPSAGTVTDA